LVAKNIFATRISSDEIEFLSRYTGAKPVRMIDDLKNNGILGNADSIYEDEDTGLIYIENGSGKNIVTIIVSGTTKETSLERWRSVIDGVNASEAALNRGIVAGGGAAEIHVIEKLKSLRLIGLDVVASALESIMRQILTNAGFNGLEKVMAAKASKLNIGIDIDSGELVNMFEKGILDPLLVKLMALEAAGEISKSVLRIDRNLAAEDLSQQSVSEIKR
jgi:chaperonin GroEL (HSP60 family)